MLFHLYFAFVFLLLFFIPTFTCKNEWIDEEKEEENNKNKERKIQ